MNLEATPLAGLWTVRIAPQSDARGFFARTFCRDTLAKAGVDFTLTQMSVSFNARAGTLRGLHWQAEPYGETKLVRVTAGAIYDVAVDLRVESATRLRWFGLTLSADNHDALLIPPGFAHGFITLTDAAEVLYAMDAAHAPDAARGARWDDPVFGVVWPSAPVVISDRDLAWTTYAP